MSEINVNKIAPSTGTNVTLGDSSDTFKVPSGVTLDVEAGATLDVTGATVSGLTSTTINNNSNNRVITGSSTANTLEGETNLQFDGEVLKVLGNPSTTISQVYNLSLENDTDGATSGDAKTGILFRAPYNDTTPTDLAGITGGKENNSNGNYASFLSFGTRTNGVNTIAERMNISSVGAVQVPNRLIVGDDGDATYGVNIVRGGNAGENGVYFNDKDGQSSYEFFTFRRQGTQIGFIRRNGSNDSVTYSTTSDYRLKDGIVDKTDGIEKLKQLKPKKFYWKSNADKTLVDGFLAHEVSSIVPESISGEKDELEKNKDGTNKLDDKGNTIPRYQGIDQSKLVPLLTSALQEAITKIETLEAKVTALENA